VTTTDPHPDDDQILLLCAGDLDDARREAVLAHCRACAPCEALREAVATELTAYRAAAPPEVPALAMSAGGGTGAFGIVVPSGGRAVRGGLGSLLTLGAAATVVLLSFAAGWYSGRRTMPPGGADRPVAIMSVEGSMRAPHVPFRTTSFDGAPETPTVGAGGGGGVVVPRTAGRADSAG